jgi:hypothetical protein
VNSDICLENLRHVKIAGAASCAAAGGRGLCFSAGTEAKIKNKELAVRQFLYGLILGVASMYCYARLDPVMILDYLNDATQYAVQSTRGYGGKQ